MIDIEHVNYLLSEAGFSPIESEDDLEFDRKVSRMAGTGYANHYYHTKDGAEVVVYRAASYYNGRFIDAYAVRSLEKVKSKKREYARECGKVSRKTGIPFSVVLAIGPKLANEISGYVPPKPTKDQERELRVGIARRKAGIKSVIGEEMYRKLGIEDMGQTNSCRIAGWLLGEE